MDLELLQLRAATMQRIRSFFVGKNYLELDTPALSTTLIPETCLEVFKTEYVEPWNGMSRPLYLVPSPEIYIKRIIAQHKVDVFQLSKCYRNVESIGRIHNPEFTMLEYYTMKADYKKSAKLTEDLFRAILPPVPVSGTDFWNRIRPPFIYLTMNDAFREYAGFYLADAMDVQDLAGHAKLLGIAEPVNHPFHTWPWDDLYELILVQCIEPKLPQTKPVVIMDYPAKVPCLAKDIPGAGTQPLWKQRWELYVSGIEIANCYTEEDDTEKVHHYFEEEGRLKQQTAKIPHAIDNGYWKIFRDFPSCSGVALGFDRLLAVISGHNTISSVLPFTL